MSELNYEAQSRKDNPFDGLSTEDRRLMFVYMCHVAHPISSPEDIEKKWGRVLQESDMPTVFEALELVEKIKGEMRSHNAGYSSVNNDSSKKPVPITGCLGMILVISCLCGLVYLGVLQHEAEKQMQAEMQAKKVAVEEMQAKKDAEAESRKESLRKDAESLVKRAVVLLSSSAANSEDLLNMGLKLEEVRKRDAQMRCLDDETSVSIAELLVKCYRRASVKTKKKTKLLAEDRIPAEASYRLALHYLPRVYMDRADEDDKVVTLSSNLELSKKYLEEAAESEHYKALVLMCVISRRERDAYLSTQDENALKYYRSVRDKRDALENTVSRWWSKLAYHPRATGADVYRYAIWISNTNPQKSLELLKKAVDMGDDKAKQEWIKRRRESLNDGNVIN